MSSYSLEVIRDDLARTRIVDLPAIPAVTLQPGEALIQVDRFALTANNITYGVAGDMIGYWQFFPAEGEWGRIPVWGIGTVMTAGDSGLNEGDEYYGYYPMSSYLVVKPEHVTARGFTDGADHRAPLPPTYNQYSLMNSANGFKRDQNNHRMVYYPLFVTGFVLDDYIEDNDYFGAEDVILSSASSKTSFSLAHLLHLRRDRKVIGLTSPGNKAFVESMGIYDRVVTYDELETLDNSRKAAFVDMAGNRQVLEKLHHHYEDMMVASIGVGITHRDARGGADPAALPGAQPAMFFAPSQIQKRNKEWGAEKFATAMNEAWDGFLTVVDNWVTIQPRTGRDEMLATYRQVLDGAPPNESYVISV
ncbi:MAG: DUF2855 family protein [Proteobacteria bacterium]|nr:DUF2855 family protein [Pseudomonadota bacterium]